MLCQWLAILTQCQNKTKAAMVPLVKSKCHPHLCIRLTISEKDRPADKWRASSKRLGEIQMPWNCKWEEKICNNRSWGGSFCLPKWCGRRVAGHWFREVTWETMLYVPAHSNSSPGGCLALDLCCGIWVMVGNQTLSELSKEVAANQEIK